MSETTKKWYVLRAVSGKEAKVKEYIDAEETARLIDAVTVEQIREVANLFFAPEKPALCVVGKPEKKEFYEKIIKEYK